MCTLQDISSRSLCIGGHTLDMPVILAPMVGVTDYPFRRLVKRFGVGLVVSEMIAGVALVRNSEKTHRMADGRQDLAPVSVQIATNDPYILSEAIKLNEQKGATFIDINMGCPVKKVVKGYAGAALMRDTKLALSLMEAAVKVASVPITVKMRLGWDEQLFNAPYLARCAEEIGISAVAVHGRTRAQLYRGEADWKKVGKVKEQLKSIPLIVNGDITTPQQAQEALNQSGADGVMVGRGTYGRPWLPAQIGAYLKGMPIPPTPSLEERKEIALEHFTHLLDYYGKEKGLRLSRKCISWYSQGLRDSARFSSIF